MRAFFFRDAFLAGAETGANKIFLPTFYHIAKHIPQRKSSVEAERVVAVYMLTDRVLMNDAQFKGFGVLTLFPDGDPNLIESL